MYMEIMRDSSPSRILGDIVCKTDKSGLDVKTALNPSILRSSGRYNI
jgi:hypothetical protein